MASKLTDEGITSIDKPDKDFTYTWTHTHTKKIEAQRPDGFPVNGTWFYNK
ncbi:MAG: hypothetical protein LBR85_02155 [Oscillospiraceae bacterium]|nr:hypothetical protein [Oscillospiraceae bacterium]